MCVCPETITLFESVMFIADTVQETHLQVYSHCIIVTSASGMKEILYLVFINNPCVFQLWPAKTLLVC